MHKALKFHKGPAKVQQLNVSAQRTKEIEKFHFVIALNINGDSTTLSLFIHKKTSKSFYRIFSSFFYYFANYDKIKRFSSFFQCKKKYYDKNLFCFSPLKQKKETK